MPLLASAHQSFWSAQAGRTESLPPKISPVKSFSLNLSPHGSWLQVSKIPNILDGRPPKWFLKLKIGFVTCPKSPWQSWQFVDFGRPVTRDRRIEWNSTVYEEMGYPQKRPTLIKGDNDGSISMAKNPQFHNRSKHIAIRWHWIRELVEQDLIKIESCCDPEQTADVLTKSLPRPKHKKHVAEMGLSSTWGGVL